MSLLIDANQVFISSILSFVSINKTKVLEEDLVRHVVLSALRGHVSKFKSEYGEIVVCLDSRRYWRKDIFPHYKSHRKENREKSDLDWVVIFKVLNALKEDLKNHFPYKVIEVDGAEADDIIGTLAPRISAHEKVLILSSDKDFVQLQKYPNVKQYNPMLGVYITSKNPRLDLKEKIIRGDRGDGIPSVLSKDSVFVEGIRQKPITAKNLQIWLEQDPEICFDEDCYVNFQRNQQLIDFDHIPTDIREDIVTEYEKPKTATKQTLFKYLVSNRLTNLLEDINDF